MIASSKVDLESEHLGEEHLEEEHLDDMRLEEKDLINTNSESIKLEIDFEKLKQIKCSTW